MISLKRTDGVSTKKLCITHAYEGGVKGGEIMADTQISEILITDKAIKAEKNRLTKIFKKYGDKEYRNEYII